MEPGVKRSVFPKTRKVISVLLVGLLLFIVAKAIVTATQFVRSTGLSPTAVGRLLFDGGSALVQTEGRTNVLVLGIAGGDHAGAKLTDTILVLSLKPEDKAMDLISIPRDIWSDTLKDRINSAYFYGEEKREGGGLTLARAIIEDITGLTLHYGLVVDFSGFKEMIDLVGGVDVDVPKAFTDPEFPIVGKEEDLCGGDPSYACRYESLHFNAGLQHMDGETALKYVRSRHAEGGEGTDFARGRRQQEVILAVRQKLTDLAHWTSPAKVRSFIDTVDEMTQSDMTIGELLTIGKLGIEADDTKTKRISIEDLLYSPPASWYGRYVLLPVESFERVHEYIASQLED